MKIEFYSAGKQIPTELRLKVDDKFDVYYSQLSDWIGYKFEFFKHQGVTAELATKITDEIVSRMIDQSYNHGSQWRECSRDVIDNDFNLSIAVFFRVRDAG